MTIQHLYVVNLELQIPEMQHMDLVDLNAFQWLTDNNFFFFKFIQTQLKMQKKKSSSFFRNLIMLNGLKEMKKILKITILSSMKKELNMKYSIIMKINKIIETYYFKRLCESFKIIFIKYRRQIDEVLNLSQLNI